MILKKSINIMVFMRGFKNVLEVSQVSLLREEGSEDVDHWERDPVHLTELGYEVIAKGVEKKAKNALEKWSQRKMEGSD